MLDFDLLRLLMSEDVSFFTKFFYDFNLQNLINNKLNDYSELDLS